MTEEIITVVVLVGGALAYWLFGDPDRSERLSSKIGPMRPLLWIFLSSIQEVTSLYAGSFVRICIWLLIMAFWVRLYLRERTQRDGDGAGTSGLRSNSGSGG